VIRCSAIVQQCLFHTLFVSAVEPCEDTCDALHCSELVACMGRKGLTIKISKANTKCRLPPRSFREYNTSDLQIDSLNGR